MGRVNRKREQRKSLNNLHREPDNKDVRHRASPARIMKLYPHLSAEQRKLIEDAGFGGLLKIRCSTVPPGLCTWLVKQFDTESCELVIEGRGRIPVTGDSVHRMLGIPNGGADVEYAVEEEAINFMHDKYGFANGWSPSVKSMETAIKKMKSADEHFLRTFMILVISTFLCPNTCLRVSPRCFPSLVDIASIKERNWSKFVVEQLTKCISEYGRKKSVGGCLFYLVILYLDSLEIRNIKISDGTPRISAWDKKLIYKVIERDMKNYGSFGKCYLKRGATGGMVALFGDVSAIANFVSSNVVQGYSPQKKEVLCNAAVNICSSIADALSKFMREVSGLEDCSGEASEDRGVAPTKDNNAEKNCSREAGKASSGASLRDDNGNRKNCKDTTGVSLGDKSVESNGDQMDVNMLPEDSSELATSDSEDTSVEVYEDGSSGEEEASDSSSTDYEDDPDWEDGSTSIRNETQKSGEGTSKGTHDTASAKEYDDRSYGEGEASDSSSTDSQFDPDWEYGSYSIRDGTTKYGEGTSKSSGHDSDIPKGQQGRGNPCTKENVKLLKLISANAHGDMAVATSAVPPARSTKEESSEQKYVTVDKKNCQPTSQLHVKPSNLRLHYSGSSSKGDGGMHNKIPIVDLGSPSSSDSDCTILRIVANPSSSVNGPKMVSRVKSGG